MNDEENKVIYLGPEIIKNKAAKCFEEMVAASPLNEFHEYLYEQENKRYGLTESYMLFLNQIMDSAHNYWWLQRGEDMLYNYTENADPALDGKNKYANLHIVRSIYDGNPMFVIFLGEQRLIPMQVSPITPSNVQHYMEGLWDYVVKALVDNGPHPTH